MRDVYVADVDLSSGDGAATGSSGRMSVPSFNSLSVDHLHGSRETGESVALVKQNGELKQELMTVRQELAESEAEVEHLTMQLADKERTLQVTKADLIETRLELQRTDERLKVRPPAALRLRMPPQHCACGRHRSSALADATAALRVHSCATSAAPACP